MDLYLTGKRVLITGASKGIGLATASLFAEEGCDVVLVARTLGALEDAAEAIRRRFPVAVDIIAANLAHAIDIERVAVTVGAVDILVNNAGAIPPGDLFAVDDKDWRSAWDLKVFGYINLTRALYPTIKERKGVIVNIIGSSGERTEPNYIAGSAGNAALMAVTRAMGSVSPRDGVRVVGINPGAVETERIRTLLEARAARAFGDKARWREFYNDTPFGRAAKAEEIANAAAFLASPRSGFTSGTILTIDDPARAAL
jgi:NAD(P)-dependent dehydrogenase (short-subunit alcohol dehydrogenase family)